MGLLAPVNALTIYRGASKTLELTVNKANVFDEDGKPVPVVLQSVKLLFSVKCFASEQPAIIQKTTDAPAEITITAPYAGKAKIFLLPADTQRLDPGVYTYDVWLYFVLTGQRYIIVEPSTFEIKLPVSFSPL